MSDLVPNRRSNRNNMPWFKSFFNDDVFDNFWTNTMMPMMSFGRGLRADIRENDKEYAVEADLPGVDKKDIDVKWEDNLLTISARQEDVENEEKDDYIRRERNYGEFRRSFMLDNVRGQDIKAEFDNGVLKVILPKKNEGISRGKRIEIQ